jgi:hypothetical protein
MAISSKRTSGPNNFWGAANLTAQAFTAFAHCNSLLLFKNSCTTSFASRCWPSTA